VTDVFDPPVVQRCQLHKLRKVSDRLPDALGSTVAKRMRAADHLADPLVAEAELEGDSPAPWRVPTPAQRRRCGRPG
jgi:putative transposase